MFSYIAGASVLTAESAGAGATVVVSIEAAAAAAAESAACAAAVESAAACAFSSVLGAQDVTNAAKQTARKLNFTKFFILIWVKGFIIISP